MLPSKEKKNIKNAIILLNYRSICKRIVRITFTLVLGGQFLHPYLDFNTSACMPFTFIEFTCLNLRLITMLHKSYHQNINSSCQSWSGGLLTGVANLPLYSTSHGAAAIARVSYTFSIQRAFFTQYIWSPSFLYHTHLITIFLQLNVNKYRKKVDKVPQRHWPFAPFHNKGPHVTIFLTSGPSSQ